MAAQLEQSRGSQRAFLLSVSHDLRTPLTSIRGYAEALADGTLDDADPDARKRAAAVITAEARRLERLVRDLLDLSRLDSHEFSLKPRPCDFSEIVRDAAEAFSPQARELGLDLHVQAASALPVELDPERLAQIVANLVENAVEVRDVVDRDPRAAHGRRPSRDRRCRRRAGHPGGRCRPRVRAALHGARRLPEGPSAPVSGWRSSGSSRPRWAASPRSRHRPKAVPASSSRCPRKRARLTPPNRRSHDEFHAVFGRFRNRFEVSGVDGLDLSRDVTAGSTHDDIASGLDRASDRRERDLAGRRGNSADFLVVDQHTRTALDGRVDCAAGGATG